MTRLLRVLTISAALLRAAAAAGQGEDVAESAPDGDGAQDAAEDASRTGDETPAAILDPSLLYPPVLHASIAAVVDEPAGRIYLRLVLENTGTEAITIPIYLEKYPFFESSSLVLTHQESGTRIPYPGPISVTWKKAGPTVEPGGTWDTTFALTPAWFEHAGIWTAVWQRAEAVLRGERWEITGWVAASEPETFEVPASFVTPPAP